MRKALNENPVVQAVVVGIMALVVAFLLFTRVLNQGEQAPPPGETTATDTAAAPAAPAPATPAPTEAAPAEPAPAAGATVTPPASGPAVPAPAATTDVAASFVPGPGLPEEVVVAYARNKAVVLLVVKDKGIDDRALLAESAFLRGRGDVELIVVPTKKVSKYARIMEGVDLNRVPAIVVLRPRKLTDNVPEATVSYGFRGPESVEQAVRDALFDGKNVTYDP